MDHETWRRWRLILGSDGETGQGNNDFQLSTQDLARDQALDYLYQREYATRDGGNALSQLNPVTWLDQVRKAFPKSTVDFLQKEAVERYHLSQLLTDPEVLQQSTPNMALVETLLAFRNHLSPSAMSEVRRIIKTVCQELEAALLQQITCYFSSRRMRHQHGGRKQLSNLDWTSTLRRNLKHYQQDIDEIILQNLYFYKRKTDAIPWELYLVVDQSGSMASSVIHSAVLAAIFCQVRALNTHLIVFDTQAVDLTGQVDDPVSTLLAVQLGGGTNIAGALDYTTTKITQPQRSMLVLISDFYEGENPQRLIQITKQLKESQVTLLGLAALNEKANPDYDEHTARLLEQVGMPIAAMTPDHLARWVADQVGG